MLHMECVPRAPEPCDVAEVQANAAQIGTDGIILFTSWLPGYNSDLRHLHTPGNYEVNNSIPYVPSCAAFTCISAMLGFKTMFCGIAFRQHGR